MTVYSIKLNRVSSTYVKWRRLNFEIEELFRLACF